jgi:beta-galactosidase
VQKCNHLTLHLLLHKLSKTLKLHFITNLLLLIEGITRMSQNYLNIDRFIYGGDYNPEQWLDRPDIFKQDLLLMKKAHINTVTLGVFSWSTLEPIKDCFNFTWLIDIIDKLYDNGIQVILATPSGARPRWLAETYPEVLRVREDRTRQLYGERHNHCYTSPAYRERVRIINQKLAKTFRNHPGVILWHISNEYRGECHCPLCQEAFRNWLKNKYKDINSLNRAWWTTFWSHTYNSFHQIESPSSIGDHGLHGLNLDWKRFVTDQTVDFMCEEIHALRDGGATQPVTTNFMDDYKGLNCYNLAKHIDYVSWDSYPAWNKEDEIRTAYNTALQHDLMRSMKQKPFLLMESCPSSPNWQAISKLKKPGLLQSASLQAIAHGSDSVQYFQIRQSRGGFEKFHGAVIDHYGGSDTRVFNEVTETGASLIELKQVIGSKVDSSAAIIYDMENRWAMEDAKGPRNEGLFYHESVLKSYQALRKAALNVDIINMEQSLDSYKLVVAPMLYMFRSGIETKLRTFIENGGILIMTYWSGIVNETDLCYLEGTPHSLLDVFGLRSKEIDGLYEWEENSLIPIPENSLQLHTSYKCKNLCDLVQLNGATPLMNYGSDFYQGTPALTVNQYGKGYAYYICTDAEELFYHDFYAKI